MYLECFLEFIAGLESALFFGACERNTSSIIVLRPFKILVAYERTNLCLKYIRFKICLEEEKKKKELLEVNKPKAGGEHGELSNMRDEGKLEMPSQWGLPGPRRLMRGSFLMVSFQFEPQGKQISKCFSILPRSTRTAYQRKKNKRR